MINTKEQEHAVFKFNSGMGAILCSDCYVILKTGKDFSLEELSAMKGEGLLKPQYCKLCEAKRRLTDDMGNRQELVVLPILHNRDEIYLQFIGWSINLYRDGTWMITDTTGG